MPWVGRDFPVSSASSGRPGRAPGAAAIELGFSLAYV